MRFSSTLYEAVWKCVAAGCIFEHIELELGWFGYYMHEKQTVRRLSAHSAGGKFDSESLSANNQTSAGG